MQAEELLALPDGLLITACPLREATLQLSLAALLPQARCPSCGTLSAAQQRTAHRTVREGPCGGSPVRVPLQTRRVCSQESRCLRRIFPERFPDWVLPRARLTQRFREALAALRIVLAP
jgi:transposase